jgi:hypothetical protein
MSAEMEGELFDFYTAANLETRVILINAGYTDLPQWLMSSSTGVEL